MTQCGHSFRLSFSFFGRLSGKAPILVLRLGYNNNKYKQLESWGGILLALASVDEPWKASKSTQTKPDCFPVSLTQE